MSKGYVYVLSNPSMPGIVKVGRSKRGGVFRKDELYTTGVPERFILEFEVFWEDAATLETDVHRALETFRTDKGREFFRCDVHIAIMQVVEAMVESYGCALAVGPEIDLLKAGHELRIMHGGR